MKRGAAHTNTTFAALIQRSCRYPYACSKPTGDDRATCITCHLQSVRGRVNVLCLFQQSALRGSIYMQLLLVFLVGRVSPNSRGIHLDNGVRPCVACVAVQAWREGEMFTVKGSEAFVCSRNRTERSVESFRCPPRPECRSVNFLFNSIGWNTTYIQHFAFV